MSARSRKRRKQQRKQRQVDAQRRGQEERQVPQERKAAREREPQRRSGARRRARQRIEFVLIVVAAVAAVVAYVGLRERSPGKAMPDQGNAHILSVESPHLPYNSSPPTSGPHVNDIARWGIHNSPILDELQVHNLEDGGVAVQYNCTDCGDLIQKLREVVSRYNTQVLLAPYPNMESKIALTAWTRIDTFDEFDEERIVRFIEAYRGIDHHRRR